MDDPLQTAFVFDLDGTLVDSVYQHALAWHEALSSEGIALSMWRIHRRIGMSGGLMANILLRESGRRTRRSARAAPARPACARPTAHGAADMRPLPGARELLAQLDAAGCPWAIATSGRLETAGPVLEMLGVDPRRVPVITRDQVRRAKPDPDLFIAAAANASACRSAATVVGDAIWDMLAATRARALGIGLLSGGASEGELARAGAYRVFEDPADLLEHLDEVGGRR